MTKTNFVSIYEYTTTDNQTGYLYTIRESENDINYKYFSLTIDKDGKPLVSEVKNALEQLIIEKRITLRKLNEEKYMQAIAIYMEGSNPQEELKMALINK